MPQRQVSTTHSTSTFTVSRDRFGFTGRMEFYQPADLEQVIARSAALLGVNIDTAAAAELAKRSRGTPRIANALLRRVRDYAQIHSDSCINVGVVNDALAMF